MKKVDRIKAGKKADASLIQKAPVTNPDLYYLESIYSPPDEEREQINEDENEDECETKE